MNIHSQVTEIKILAPRSAAPLVLVALTFVGVVFASLSGLLLGDLAIAVGVWVGTVLVGLFAFHSVNKATRRITKLVVREEVVEVHQLRGISLLWIEDLAFAQSPKAPRFTALKKAMVGYLTLLFIDETNVDDCDAALQTLPAAIPKRFEWSENYDKSFRQIAFEQIMDDISNR